jgi:sphingomyelin phosphodiesterase acid-like 3
MIRLCGPKVRAKLRTRRKIRLSNQTLSQKQVTHMSELSSEIGPGFSLDNRTPRKHWLRLLAHTLLCGTVLLLAISTSSHAQTPQKTPPTIPALFLSDIHFNPYADPAKVAKLNAAPASDWPTILAAPPSSTQPQDFAALTAACPTRGTDTDYPLFQSSLKAIHTNAAAPTPVRFVTISGDLMAHSFDCKYKTLLPTSTPSEYVAFTQKTIHYIISSLQAALPGIPIYTAMGNNDSGCTDYHLDASQDPFLAAVAPTVADALLTAISKAERKAILTDFATGGFYSAPLASLPHTRLIVLDDLFLSPKHSTCPGKPDPTPAAAQLAWLSNQLASARQHHERVWVMGHIPPGVDLYSTARKFLNICTGAKPTMFLASDSLAQILANNADVIRLALFGHTHNDELRLLTPPLTTDPSPLITDHLPLASTSPGVPPLTTNHLSLTTASPGVPLKLVASISPINGNRPTFTLAQIDPTTATLIDYTVIQSSNLTGTDTGSATTWAPSYTYSTTYHQPAFDAASLSTLITGFTADPAARTPASQSYLHNFFPGGKLAPLLQLVWPQYTCSLNHTSAAAFASCACATTPAATQ